mmetsp:Transcript_91728/g.255457  ORF Transcript_91728/g.255457 Transcript_91728/m.255457 type:complete len:218 (+) Transcript_91728:385-1038(+)
MAAADGTRAAGGARAAAGRARAGCWGGRAGEVHLPGPCRHRRHRRWRYRGRARDRGALGAGPVVSAPQLRARRGSVGRGRRGDEAAHGLQRRPVLRLFRLPGGRLRPVVLPVVQQRAAGAVRRGPGGRGQHARLQAGACRRGADAARVPRCPSGAGRGRPAAWTRPRPRQLPRGGRRQIGRRGRGGCFSRFGQHPEGAGAVAQVRSHAGARGHAVPD